MEMVALILGKIIIGWLIADFLTGIVHWWEDRVASERMPLIGPIIIAPNRLHHRDPMAFTRGSFLDRNLATWAVTAAVSAFWYWLLGPSIIWAAATLGGAVSAMVHYLAHQPVAVWSPLRVLQETGAIQSARHHARHHRPPSAGRYCVLTDWLNPTLDALQIWKRVEKLLSRLGLEPSRGVR